MALYHKRARPLFPRRKRRARHTKPKPRLGLQRGWQATFPQRGPRSVTDPQTRQVTCLARRFLRVWLRPKAALWSKLPVVSCALAACAMLAGCGSPMNEVLVTAPAVPGGDIIIRVATAQNEDPYDAGKAAALALREQLGDATPHIILVSECYPERYLKKRALRGVFAVFEPEKVFGCATYGTFAQSGALDRDAIGLMAIAGPGISVAAALQTGLGTARLTPGEDDEEIQTLLNAAGERLARRIPRTPQDKVLVTVADAHSPKNAHLVKGLQDELGKDFPITGGCANKNAGQTYVYYRGDMYRDSAVAIMLSGDFKVALSGRMAKTNEAVIASAKEGAAEAAKALGGKPIAALAFNCAGRKGKLDDIQDELAAMQQALGKSLPLFGCYCAGEIGPADQAEKTEALSSGVGWHVMFTLLGR